MMNHGLQLVATNDVRNGTVKSLICAHDNSNCAIVTQTTGYLPIGLETPITRYVFNDMVVLEQVDHDPPPTFCMSFDGRKFATAEPQLRDERFVHVVKINGDPQYVIPSDTILALSWLDERRLACMVVNQDADRKKKMWSRPKRHTTCFVNGKLESDLEIFHHMTEDLRTSATIRHGNRQFTLLDDGTMIDGVDYDPDNPFGSDHVYPEQPKEMWDDSLKEVRVRFRNATTVNSFHAIESFGGLRQYIFNRDRTRVSYVGIRYPTLSRRLQKMAEKIIQRGEEDDKLGRLLFIPTVILFNMYSGPLYHMTEATRRFHPVNHDKPWRKGYENVEHYFLTPKDNLVAVVTDGKKFRVVIDEKEGPAFDQIVNVRWLKNRNHVCYMGRRKNDIFRVIVH